MLALTFEILPLWLASVFSLVSSPNLEPPQIEALVRRADAAYRLGKLDEAVDWLQKAADQEPTNGPLQQMLGVRAREAGRLDIAKTASEKAIEVNPNDGNSYWNLGAVLHSQGRLQDSIARLRTAAKKLPKNPGVFQALGLALSDAHQYESAARAFETASTLSPQIAEYHYLLGLARSHLLDSASSASVESFQKALSLEPEHPFANYHFGRILSEEGRVSEAIPHLRQALAKRPDIPGVYFSLGNVLMRTGSREEGRKLLTTFADLEKRERNRSTLDRLIELRPRKASLRCRRAEILIKQGKILEALEDLRVARESEPLHLDVLTLSAALDLRRSRPKSALEMADQALVIDPEYVPAMFRRAQALLQLRRTAKGYEQLKALEGPLDDDPDYHELRAQALDALDRKQEAEEARKTAAEKRKEQIR